jgi:hypothetical protein
MRKEKQWRRELLSGSEGGKNGSGGGNYCKVVDKERMAEEERTTVRKAVEEGTTVRKWRRKE